MRLNLDENDAKGELLPCPFCGSAAHLSSVCGWHAVGCVGSQICPVYLRAQTHRTEAGAIAAWNCRAEREDLAPSPTATDVSQYSKRDRAPGEDGFPYG